MIGESHNIFEEKAREYKDKLKGKNKSIIGINLPEKTYDFIATEEIPIETKLWLMNNNIWVRQYLNFFDTSKPLTKIAVYNPKNISFIIGEKDHLKEIGEKSGGDYTIHDLI